VQILVVVANIQMRTLKAEEMDRRSQLQDEENRKAKLKIAEKMMEVKELTRSLKMKTRRSPKPGSSSDAEDEAEEDQIPPPPPAIVATTLTADVPAGSSRIEVGRVTGFKIGAKVRIGTSTNAEVRIIVGFGSLLLDEPTHLPHVMGEPVTLVVGQYSASAAPIVRRPASSANDSDDSSRTGTDKKGKFEYKKPSLLALPKEHWECKSWLRKTIERVEAASSRTDSSERMYLLKVLEVTDARDPWLFQVPKEMMGMDKVLLPELQKLCEKDKALNRDGI